LQHRLQARMRESPASDRRHGSRQVARSLSGGNCVDEENVTSSPATPSQNHSFAGSDTNLNAASHRAATGEERKNRKEGQAVAVTKPSPRLRAIDRESRGGQIARQHPRQDSATLCSSPTHSWVSNWRSLV